MKDFSPLASGSSFSNTISKGDGSLLPKLNNAKVFQDTITPQHSRQERERKTNSNIFIEEPDKYIIPGGQPVQHVPRVRTPDEIPLKEIPMKSSSDTPSTDGETVQLLPAPPIPPKTYIKVKFEETDCSQKQPNTDVSDNSGEADTKASEVLVQVELKQNTTERGKGVRFHSDVKFPNEVEPPRLPTRDHVDSDAVVAGSDSITMDTITEGTNPTQSRNGLKIAVSDIQDRPEEGGVEIAIVNKDGVVVGEMVCTSSTNPVADDNNMIQTTSDDFPSDVEIFPCPSNTELTDLCSSSEL